VTDGRLVRMGSQLLSTVNPWFLSRGALDAIRTAGLDRLSEMLRSDRRSEFETRLLDSLLVYSKAALELDPSDKLIYILVALESILRRDQNESIVQNVGERMAFVLGGSVDDKRSVIKNVKNTYGLRSSVWRQLGIPLNDN